MPVVTLLAVFAVLIVIEWRWRLRSVRLATALFAVYVMWWWSAPLTTSVRTAIAAQHAARPTARVTHSSARNVDYNEYESGVYTLAREIREDNERVLLADMLGFGVLLWLACSPAFRRAPHKATRESIAPDFAERPEAP